MLSVSSYWMREPQKGIKYWLQSVKDFGFDAVELSYRLTHEDLRIAEECLEKIGLKVSSLHNFCPTPNDESSERHPSNHYRLSALDEHERQQAVKWTKNTVDVAKRLKAGAVVIHAGSPDIEDIRSSSLIELFEQGKAGTDEFMVTREKWLKLRRETIAPYIKAIEKTFTELLPYAKDQNIKIGIETRYYPLEIPNCDEIGHFLNLFADQGLGYWHDVGHAEMNSRLGVTPHLNYLEKYKDFLIGVHLHGMTGRRDHYAPFEGDLDLNALLPYFGPNVLRVIESKPHASVEYMKEAIKKLS